MTLKENRDKSCRDKRKETVDPITRKDYIDGVLDMYNAIKTAIKTPHPHPHK